MHQQKIRQFLDKFFRAAGCEILESKPEFISVQLTVDMDKELMNRPFYWHYVEKTGGVPNPQTLTLITDFEGKTDVKGERIHFGSPRLHQIFRLTTKVGGFIRMFENKKGSLQTQTPLIPWLCVNMKISYICDRKKDRFRSIGLNLIQGTIVEPFHDKLIEERIDLTAKIPDFSFTFTPLIKPVSGLKRIEQYVLKDLKMEDFAWAEEAVERLKADEELLQKFYQDTDEKPESYYNELAALKEQFEPKIEVDIINGGIFYLTGKKFSN